MKKRAFLFPLAASVAALLGVSSADASSNKIPNTNRALGRCAGMLWATQDALQPARALGGQGRVGR